MISRSKGRRIDRSNRQAPGVHAHPGFLLKGRRSGLDAMIDYLNSTSEKRLCGTPVDGPKGPNRKMKKGMLAVAKETGSVFIPMACCGNRVITFPKAWDKTILPKPFSKMVVDFDEACFYSKDVTDEEFESIRCDLEIKLDQLTDKVDQICGYQGA